jgi:phage terminase large subunit-like protein
MKLHPAEQYIKDVLSGKQIACEYVKLAVQRHVNDLEKGHKRGLKFNPHEAQRWIDFAHLFNHHKNKKFAGNPIILEPHQQFYFWCLMGWQKKNDRSKWVRRFSSSYKEVARKNGKTTETGILTNGHLFLDGEQGAQAWFVATKRDQALIALNDAAKIAKATPEIDEYYQYTQLKDTVQRIIKPDTGSFMAAIGRDSDREDGHDPSWGTADEVHEHPTLAGIDIIESGMGAREQPMMTKTTTAGYDKRKPCYSIIRKAVIDILTGASEDDSSFGIIYTPDDPDKWDQPEEYIKANPNLGVSVEPSYVSDRIIKAKNEGGETEVNVKTKNCNIWTDAAKVWIQDVKWMKCKEEPKDIHSKIWFGGLDLASTEDFCSYVLFSEPDSDGIHDILCWSWIPEESLRERQKKDKKDYRSWIQQGYLFTTPGTATDYDFIEHFILKKHDVLDIRGNAYDKWNAQMLVNNLNNKGCKFFELGQGIAAQSPHTKMLKQLALKVKLRHGGHPVLQWNINNASVKMDANENIMLDKSESTEKIDGARSLVNAIGMYTNREKIQLNTVGIVWA